MKQISPYAPRAGLTQEQGDFALLMERSFFDTFGEMKAAGARLGMGAEFTARLCAAIYLRAAAEMTVTLDIAKGEETDSVDFALAAREHIDKAIKDYGSNAGAPQ